MVVRKLDFSPAERACLTLSTHPWVVAGPQTVSWTRFLIGKEMEILVTLLFICETFLWYSLDYIPLPHVHHRDDDE